MQMGQPGSENKEQKNGVVDNAQAESDAKTGVVAIVIAAIVLLIVGKPVKTIVMGSIAAGAAVHLALTALRLVKKAMEKPKQ